MGNTKKQNIKRWAVLATVLALIPLTIAFGIFALGDRKYFFISLMLVIYAMIPFFLKFEKRRPKAREIIIISVLAAICVAGRVVFYVVPHFKPVVSIVIITGVCFGAESGFLVGAVTGLASNFFFGQGPWTPWQMLCFGIIGLLAGTLFFSGPFKASKLRLCVFGAIVTLVIYGGVMNISAVLMYTQTLTLDAVLAKYVTGLPVDLVHSLSTIVFMLLLSEPMIEKLTRIKLKYGIIE